MCSGVFHTYTRTRNAIKLVILDNVIPTPITRLVIAIVTSRIAIEEEIQTLPEKFINEIKGPHVFFLTY